MANHSSTLGYQFGVIKYLTKDHGRRYKLFFWGGGGWGGGLSTFLLKITEMG